MTLAKKKHSARVGMRGILPDSSCGYSPAFSVELNVKADLVWRGKVHHTLESKLVHLLEKCQLLSSGHFSLYPKLVHPSLELPSLILHPCFVPIHLFPHLFLHTLQAPHSTMFLVLCLVVTRQEASQPLVVLLLNLPPELLTPLIHTPSSWW